MPEKTPVLLHICCAPDATAVQERLADTYRVIGYFHNPNIYPQAEYLRRLEAAQQVADNQGFQLIIAEYDPAGWEKAVRGWEKEPEQGRRCQACFEYNLNATAAQAKRLGIRLFTTTLTISPHKRTAQVFAAGQAAARARGLEFLALDFKKQDGFKRSLEISRALGLYRQDYCGCQYSRDRSGHA